jgi:hypothetical protein
MLLPQPALAASSATIIARYQVSTQTATELMRYDAADDRIWVVDTANAQLVALDPATGATLVRVGIPENLPAGGVADIAFGNGAVWMTHFNHGGPGLLFKLDPATGAVLATYSTGGNGAEGLAFMGGGLWVANHHQDAVGTSGSVVELDPATGTELRHVMVGAQQDCCGPQNLTAAAGSIWAGVPNLVAVVRITPTATGTATQVIDGGSTNHAKKGIGAACGPLAADGAGHVFFADGGCLPSGLGRIDLATNASVEYPESGTVWGLAPGLGSMWISVGGQGGGEWSSFVARVDPATGAVLGKTATGNQTGYGDVQVDSARGLVYASTFSGVILVLKP